MLFDQNLDSRFCFLAWMGSNEPRSGRELQKVTARLVTTVVLNLNFTKDFLKKENSTSKCLHLTEEGI